MGSFSRFRRKPAPPGPAPVLGAFLLSSLFALSVGLSGCSAGNGPEPMVERVGGFQVTVHSDGQEVRNFEKELVHRVELSRAELGRLRDIARTARITVPGRDGQGGFQGLKVRNGLPADFLNALALRPGDVVTAFGAKRVEPDMSFADFLLSLEAATEESLTLLRKGEPHKVLYSIEALPQTGKEF